MALGAGLATALFAVHPLRAEAVAWASCQPYLPCALFSMLAVLAYLRAAGRGPRRGGVGWWLVRPVRGGALVQGGGGEPAGSAADPGRLSAGRLGGGPGAGSGRRRGRCGARRSPSSLLSFVFMGLGHRGQGARAHDRVDSSMPALSARIAQACYGIWFYLVKTVLPLEITAYYPLPERIDWFAPPFLLAILGSSW